MRKFLTFALLALPAAGFAQSDKKWKDAAELTYLNSKGNTDVETFGVNNTFTDQWGWWGMELKAGALTSNTAGTTTAEQYNASEKGTRKFTDTFYVYERYAWDKNRFSGIDDRHDTSAGLGAEALRTKLDLLALELGGGYVAESRAGGPEKNFGSGRAYAKYTRKLSDTATFTQDAEYLHDFGTPKNYRVNTETALVASLTTHFSLKVSYKYHRVNLPPAGFKKEDTIAGAALIVNF